MVDFSQTAYKEYLIALKSNSFEFLTFEEYFKNSTYPTKFCLLRHDVDRKPHLALQMAKIESELGVKATYYFRAKQCSFREEIVKEIYSLGHEIGYHYESLADMNGDMPKSIDDFKINLANFRKVVPISTCSMHGSPLKPYDNRDIWRIEENHKLLKNELGILGEVYLDIDYSDIAYINDTGRNWTSGKSNRRDKVLSNISADFESGEELLNYFKSNPHNHICFQIHPERWSNNSFEWASQYLKDGIINFAKVIVGALRK